MGFKRRFNLPAKYKLPESLEWHPASKLPDRKYSCHYQFLLLMRSKPKRPGGRRHRLQVSLWNNHFDNKWDHWQLWHRQWSVVAWAYLAPSISSGEQQR